MKEYEILVETVNPCGGEHRAKKKIIEAECESGGLCQGKRPYPVIDSAKTTMGDTLSIAGDGKDSMICYTFAEI